ncbi:hypothetical protein MRX96_037451 [Rhipicephalus microplus]
MAQWPCKAGPRDGGGRHGWLLDFPPLRTAEAAHWAAVGSSFAGSAMPVASAQHKESAASTVSRYLLPKPPRHSPPLLPSPGPHHGFSPDPQACLQVSALSAVSAGAIGIRRLTRVICRMPAASRMRTPNPGPTVAVQGFPGSTRSPAGGHASIGPHGALSPLDALPPDTKP